MASYLESYGAVEEHKARQRRFIKLGVLLAIVVAIVGTVAYALFKNFSEESRAKEFLQLMANQQYQDAYRLWGCTEATPCRDYSFPKFMDDWGPKSGHANASAAKISMSQSCGSGVLIRLDYPGAEAVTLWVERKNDILSFAPWPECPGKHWHIGTFLRGLFSH
ncbi:MAG TPA: hypothetical protein VKU01_25130 [Bryobacteraceae bacterium]|nr:hypothetical protein [Bryobacteraceae bacterium]